MISKDQKENVICTIDDVRGDFLGPPHGIISLTVLIANKNEVYLISKASVATLTTFFAVRESHVKMSNLNQSSMCEEINVTFIFVG